MKKLLALLLILILAAPTLCALAETEGMTETRDEKLNLVYLTSDEWIPLTKDSLYANYETVKEILTSEQIQNLMALAEQAPQSHYFSPLFDGNLNIYAQASGDVTIDVLFMLRAVLVEQVKRQFSEAYGVDVAVEAEESLYKAGDNRYIVLHTNTGEAYMDQYMTIIGDRSVVITVSEPQFFEQEIIDAMLASLRAL